MLKLFQKNMMVQVLLLVVAMALLWARALAHPAPVTLPLDAAPLGLWLHRLLAPLPLLGVVLAMVFIVAEGLMLNVLLASVGLVSQTSLLPALLYCIFMSATATTFTPMIIVNGVMLACLSQLVLRSSSLTIPVGKACNATALIGLCTLFYQPSVAMLIAYLLIAISYRLYSWRDWAVMLLGFAAPYLLLFTVWLLMGRLQEGWHLMLAGFQAPGLRMGDTTTLRAVANGVLVAVGLAGIVRTGSAMGEHPVVWQRNANTVLLMAVGGVAMLLLTTLFPVDMTFFAIPLAFGVALLLGKRRRRNWILDIVLVLTFVAALLC